MAAAPSIISRYKMPHGNVFQFLFFSTGFKKKKVDSQDKILREIRLDKVRVFSLV